MRIETHSLPKTGHAPEENEDAWDVSAKGFPFRAAVADGATESAFSGEWARALAAAYVAHGDLVEAAATARAHFSPAPDGRWYVQQKAAEGAHAALLGLEILEEGTWRAEAVGDCCLFHVRETLLCSWPFVAAAAFHHRPRLISSLAPHSNLDVDATSGRWAPGDTFVLATDALAAWLLGEGVEALLDADDVEELLLRARRARSASLRDDDATAVLIRL